MAHKQTYSDRPNYRRFTWCHNCNAGRWIDEDGNCEDCGKFRSRILGVES